MSGEPERGPTPLVLMVEDDAQMLLSLRATLVSNHYRVAEATTGEQGLLFASARHPDVILLDLGLPDIDGLEVTRRLREWSRIPIVVLSARGQESDKVQALDAGADDYLTKPFGSDELLARIRVALRHSAAGAGASAEPVFESAALRVDRRTREVWVLGNPVRLTPIEWRLLSVLLDHAGMVVTHRQLLQDVWGPAHVNETHYLRVYLSQLRRKLEPDPARPRNLITEPGVGYRLRVE
jgi:two-component system KDP operon response regulator KdpE